MKTRLTISTYRSLGVLTDGVADLAICLLLATSRRVSEAMQAVRVSDLNRKRSDFIDVTFDRMGNGVHLPASCGCVGNL